MRMFMLATVGAVMLMTGPMAATAGEARSFAKGIVVSDTDSITSVVEEIDYPARTVKLRGPQGGLVELTVNQSAKNFDQVKKGDLLTLDYYASLTLKLQKSADAPASAEASAVQTVPKGQKPKIVRVDTAEGVVTIEGIDAKERAITVRNPKGEVKTHAIGENVEDFEKLKVGDQIYYSYTQAVTLEVRSPSGAPK